MEHFVRSFDSGSDLGDRALREGAENSGEADSGGVAGGCAPEPEQANRRMGARHRLPPPLRIVRANGSTVPGVPLDMSGEDIGFKTTASLNDGEIIEIMALTWNYNSPTVVSESVKVVREELVQATGEHLYGAVSVEN